MQIFLDSTDTKIIADLAATGLVDGVTTNPTLIAKAGRPMLEVIAEICELVPGPISAEVAATTAEAMIAEGYPAPFVDGYEAGCSSGRQAAGASGRPGGRRP